MRAEISSFAPSLLVENLKTARHQAQHHNLATRQARPDTAMQRVRPRSTVRVPGGLQHTARTVVAIQLRPCSRLRFSNVAAISSAREIARRCGRVSRIAWYMSAAASTRAPGGSDPAGSRCG
jgi:hypothetical protein